MTKTFLLLFLGTLIAITVLHLSLSRFANSQLTAGCSPQSLTGEIDITDTVAFWENYSLESLLSLSPSLSPVEIRVLGTTTGEKWIEIDLSDQRLIAHQADQIFLESLVSSGLWNKTPSGEYSIWFKIRSTKMEGGIKGQRSYYYLPNVPYAMFFKGSYGIHGTYWHNNFGQRMSHGCVNAPTSVAEKLFYWTNPQIPPGKNMVRASEDNPGTRVVIHD